MEDFKKSFSEKRGIYKDISLFIEEREKQIKDNPYLLGGNPYEIAILKLCQYKPKIEEGHLFVGDRYIKTLVLQDKPIPKNYEYNGEWLDLYSPLTCFSYIDDVCFQRLLSQKKESEKNNKILK